MRSLSLAVSLAVLTAVALPGCGGSEADTDSQALAETEAFLGSADECAAQGKVLVCHVPPGNPANAHTICIGEPAVRAHQKNHGDALGACGTTGDDGSTDPDDPGTTSDDPGGSTDPDDPADSFEDGLPNVEGGDDAATGDPADGAAGDDPGATGEDGSASDDGAAGEATDPGTTGSGEAVCLAENQACQATADCCAGLTCDQGTCLPQIN